MLFTIGFPKDFVKTKFPRFLMNAKKYFVKLVRLSAGYLTM